MSIHPCPHSIFPNKPSMFSLYLSYYSYEAVLRRAEQNTPNAAQIEKDLRRTMPTNQHFQKEEGIDALRCVLLAYSERNKTLGYCQSMNFIAAILLLHMECDDVFWCLAAIVEDILPKNWFDGELHGSLVEPMVLQSCVRWKLPKLYEHIYNLDVKVNTKHTHLLFSAFCFSFSSLVYISYNIRFFSRKSVHTSYLSMVLISVHGMLTA
jgi:hypothetical protein